MLGELVGEGRGKRTGRRVLATEGGRFKLEVSFESADKVLGIDMNEIGTYIAETRPDGTLFGEGQGVLVSADGDSATWKGQGVGKFNAGGSVSYRGAVYYTTTSPKLARLNSVAALFEFEVDAEGNTESKLWEWK
jgi:hypothetical protein